jgi:exodeoxyribonuclease V beta subunit
MCGPKTPVVDGHTAGVFSWQPPVSLITAMSGLLDSGRAAA